MIIEIQNEIDRLGGSVEFDDSGMIDGIDLANCEVSDETLRLLHSKYAVNVSNLDLMGTLITDEALALLEFLPSLEYLNLSGTQITGTGFDGEKTKNLKVLRMCDCPNLTTAGFSRLSTVHSLENLMLINSRVEDSDMEYIAKLPQLKKLFLNKTNITDHGLAKLSIALELRNLLVWDTNTTHETFAHLRTILPHLRGNLKM